MTTAPAYDPNDPILPYAGTSGWSGSATSHDRAVREDNDGTTAGRQRATIAVLTAAGATGATWADLADRQGWNHGQASGVLSRLHQIGAVARLTEARNRCQVYVLPEHVNGRDTAAHGRNRPRLTDAQVEAVTRYHAAVDRARRMGRADVPLRLPDAAIIADVLAGIAGRA